MEEGMEEGLAACPPRAGRPPAGWLGRGGGVDARPEASNLFYMKNVDILTIMEQSHGGMEKYLTRDRFCDEMFMRQNNGDGCPEI